jgi:hypothetical protein
MSEHDVIDDTDVDVDTDLESDEVEEVPAGSPATPKAVKAPTAPKRGDLPEGYVTPVMFAKYLTENGLVKDGDGNDKAIPPQVVYSYIKNAPKDHPFPNTDDQNVLNDVIDSNDVPRKAFLLKDGVEWWNSKTARAAERKANAATKAAKKTEPKLKSAATPPGEDGDVEEDGPVQEAE